MTPENKRRWSYVLYAASGLLLLAALLVATDTIWSDFAQKVYVAVLGSSGSAAVVITLYFLKRWHDRQDTEALAKLTEQKRLQSALLDYIRDRMDEAATSADRMMKPTAFSLMCSLAGAKFYEFETLLDDSELKKLCKTCRRVILSVGAGIEPGVAHETHLKAIGDYTGLFVMGMHELTKYVATGQAIEVNRIKQTVESKKPPAK